jgi:hypothetical protein
VVVDQEPEALEPLAEGEGEVAGLLHGPFASGVRGDGAAGLTPEPEPTFLEGPRPLGSAGLTSPSGVLEPYNGIPISFATVV